MYLLTLLPNHFYSAVCKPHLVVQIEVVELSVGPEVLRVSVQGEVDVAAVALDHHRVPMVVIQQASGGHGGVAQDGAILITSCCCRDRGGELKYDLLNV